MSGSATQEPYTAHTATTVHRPTKAAWASKGVLALTDQGLIAAANFLVALLLARQVPRAEYGAYALAFEVFLLMVVVYSAFILEPMSVFGPSQYKHCLREYMGTILRLHVWVTLFTIAVVGSAAGVVYWFNGNHILARALVGVAVAGPCVLFFWVVRRTYYLNLLPGLAAIGAMVYSGVLLSGLFFCYRLHLLSPMVVFLLMSAAALVTGPVLLTRLNKRLSTGANPPATDDVVRRHWTYGRWALASSITTWGTGAIFYFGVSTFCGLAITGELKALLNLSSPIGQGFAAISLLSLPYASRLQQSAGTGSLKRLVGRLTVLYAGGTAAYFAGVILFGRQILHLLYGDKYASVVIFIPLVGLAMVLRLASTSQAVVLRALQSPNLVFASYSASAIVAAVVGIPAIWAFGLRGAVVANVLSAAAALVLAITLLRRKLHQREATLVQPETALVQPETA